MSRGGLSRRFVGAVLVAGFVALPAWAGMALIGQPASRVLRAPASELHTVDGLSMTAERPCDRAADAWCARWLARARAALALPASVPIAGVSLASDGYVYGGFSVPVVVVLDVAGGGRRAVELSCGPYDINPASPPTPLPSGDWPCTVVTQPSAGGS